jgi:hypothetical protein
MQIDSITSASNGTASLAALKTDIDDLDTAVTTTLPALIASSLNQLPFTTIGFSSDCDYVCDGVEDDVQINAAMVAVNAAGGGTIYFKDGTYALKNVVTILSNIKMISSAGTYFVGRSGGYVDGLYMFLINGGNNIEVLGGTFTKDGTSPTATHPQSGKIWATYGGLYATTSAYNFKIRGCNAIGVFGFITVANSTEFDISGNYCRNCLAAIAVVSSGAYARNFYISNNIIKDCYDDAIAVIGQAGNFGIKNFAIVGNVMDQLDQTVDSGRGVYIGAISANQVDTGTITGNTMMNFQLEGIWTTSYTRNLAIVGNTIKNTGISTSSTYYAIQIDSGSSSNIISNNIIADQSYPIRVGGANANIVGPTAKSNIANADSIAAGNYTVNTTAT